MQRSVASSFFASVILVSVVACSSSAPDPEERLGHVAQAAGVCAGDSACTTGEFCNTQTSTCTPKLAKGAAMPAISGHTPPLTGVCTPDAAAVVCTAAVCDTADNKCAYAAGHSGCNQVNAAAVCRSSLCSVANVCIDPGTCAIDADCAATEFCTTNTKLCTTKLSNGTAIPTVPGHNPPLSGVCTASNGPLVCASGLCDPTDNKCGYADGNGSCNATTGATLCRSGVCAPTGICGAASGCTTDSMCTVGQFCNTQSSTCTPKLANGDSIPTISGHAPALTGKCATGVGASVCAAGVCDIDDKCGLAETHGPCSASTAAQVCRAGMCTATNVCLNTTGPKGCTDDLKCKSSEFCDTATSACITKIANGEPIPTIAGHTPDLAGKCTDATAKAACASAVCDTADDRCGIADDHECLGGEEHVICRSGQCARAGRKCGASTTPPPPPTPGCGFDSQCPKGQYCDNPTRACKLKLANGESIPKIEGHLPEIVGTCTADSATLCVSNICDPADQRCGFGDGRGSCNSDNAAVVCRSKTCEPNGRCGFVDDGSLEGGGCNTGGGGGGSSAPLAVIVALGLALRGSRRKPAGSAA